MCWRTKKFLKNRKYNGYERNELLQGENNINDNSQADTGRKIKKWVIQNRKTCGGKKVSTYRLDGQMIVGSYYLMQGKGWLKEPRLTCFLIQIEV